MESAWSRRLVRPGAAEWLEYMTAAAPTALAKERAANGHPEPYKVGFLGIGNESWDCGGAMTPDYYVSLMKVYSRFVLNMNPAQREKDQMLKIAVGPGTPDTEWTEAVMKAWKKHIWAWDINGLSLHWYTVPNGWPPSTKSKKFGLDDCVKSLKSTLFMDEFLRKQEAVMDKYEPGKKVTLTVDEWGIWHAPLARSNPAFLVQQNSIRDAILASLNLNIFARHGDRVRMANVAQMVNVLQAMILTDNSRMVLTPAYHIFKMYVPFQDSTLVPVGFDAGNYTRGDVTLPRLDAIAAKGVDGKLLIAGARFADGLDAGTGAVRIGLRIKLKGADILFKHAQTPDFAYSRRPTLDSYRQFVPESHRKVVDGLVN